MTTDQTPADRPASLAELEIRSELFDAMDGNLRMSKRHKLLDAYRDAVLAAVSVSPPPPATRADTLRELEQRYRPNTPPSRPDASPAAAPIKQRADITEAEWAEQERARFERLYTRESARADTAARDADIYQQRLERLGEGYTKQRKRAEQAESEAERLRTERAAVCICEHTQQQHFEDACLACDCGDYLPPAAAREVITRYQEAVKPNAADRAAVLNAAAQRLYTALFPAVYADMGQKAAEGVNRAVSELRRMADEEQPTTEARPVPLATPCILCQHPFNWHDRNGCQFGNEVNRCGCSAFAPGEKPAPVDPRTILGIDAEEPQS